MLYDLVGPYSETGGASVEVVDSGVVVATVEVVVSGTVELVVVGNVNSVDVGSGSTVVVGRRRPVVVVRLTVVGTTEVDEEEVDDELVEVARGSMVEAGSWVTGGSVVGTCPLELMRSAGSPITTSSNSRASTATAASAYITTFTR